MFDGKDARGLNVNEVQIAPGEPVVAWVVEGEAKVGVESGTQPVVNGERSPLSDVVLVALAQNNGTFGASLSETGGAPTLWLQIASPVVPSLPVQSHLKTGLVVHCPVTV